MHVFNDILLFYKYQPPCPLEEIKADIKTLEMEIMEMLREVTNG